ncbi:MAG TPA: exosortase/archaeosortase family protein, partial [Gammaproteobacteria bacterium]|nr:exosortase/archaeosortase family protein [Gammaproteobacteria bacterium]
MINIQPCKSGSKYIFIYMIFILMLYYPTSVSLYKLWILDDWNVNRYSHGPLLLGVAVFLFYQRWSYLHKRGELNFSISMTGALLVALISLAWFYINSILARQILLVMLLCGFLFMVFGYRSARKLMLPIILLVAAMPVWKFVNSG